jgi:hypothetical protein
VVKLIEKVPKAPGSTKWVLKKRMMSSTVHIRWLERVDDDGPGWLLEWHDRDLKIDEHCDSKSVLKVHPELTKEIDGAEVTRYRLTQEEVERLVITANLREDSSEDSSSGNASDHSDSSSDGVAPEFDLDVICRQASSNSDSVVVLVHKF